MFVGYIYYQWLMSTNSPSEVVEKKHVEMVIKNLEAGNATLRGALYYELLEFKNNIGSDVPGGGTGPTYQSVGGGAAADVWGKLPDSAKARFSAIIKHFWVKFVPKADKEKGVSMRALGKLFKTMGEEVKEDGRLVEVESVFLSPPPPGILYYLVSYL